MYKKIQESRLMYREDAPLKGRGEEGYDGREAPARAACGSGGGWQMEGGEARERGEKALETRIDSGG